MTGRLPFWLVLLLAVSRVPAAPAPDQWLTNAAFLPPGEIRSHDFDTLCAEGVARKVRIFWTNAVSTNVSVTLRYSVDYLGHWPAREWRSWPMLARPNGWEAFLPVDDVDVPVVYYLRVEAADRQWYSPARYCVPRAVGLEEPSRPFWAFLEGFEEGGENWQLMAPRPQDKPLRVVSQSKNGRAALAVNLPSGRRSVAVGTTRVRGWLIEHNLALGARVWLRTTGGTAQAQFSLLANAFTTNQTVHISTNLYAVGPAWQRADVPFRAFPKLPRSEVDMLVIEFTGQGPCEFLVDDLSLLGRWKLEME